MDKLKNDFNQKFDESDEEIFRKAKKDAKRKCKILIDILEILPGKQNG